MLPHGYLECFWRNLVGIIRGQHKAVGALVRPDLGVGTRCTAEGCFAHRCTAAREWLFWRCAGSSDQTSECACDEHANIVLMLSYERAVSSVSGSSVQLCLVRISSRDLRDISYGGEDVLCFCLKPRM